MEQKEKVQGTNWRGYCPFPVLYCDTAVGVAKGTARCAHGGGACVHDRAAARDSASARDNASENPRLGVEHARPGLLLG